MATQGLEGLASAGSAPLDFFIGSLEDRYRVHSVPHAGNVCVVDIHTELEDNGAVHSQNEWIQLLTKAGEWKLAPGPLYFAVLGALYKNRNISDAVQKQHVEEVRRMFANDFEYNAMMTGTRIRYTYSNLYIPNGLDRVVHDVGYATERTEEANIVGANGYINKAPGFDGIMRRLMGIDICEKITMRMLMGTDDCQKINEVCTWLTGTKPYLLRLNSKPTEDFESSLAFGISYDDRFYICAIDSPNDKIRARGMVVRGAENS